MKILLLVLTFISYNFCNAEATNAQSPDAFVCSPNLSELPKEKQNEILSRVDKSICQLPSDTFKNLKNKKIDVSKNKNLKILSVTVSHQNAKDQKDTEHQPTQVKLVLKYECNNGHKNIREFDLFCGFQNSTQTDKDNNMWMADPLKNITINESGDIVINTLHLSHDATCYSKKDLTHTPVCRDYRH